VRGGRLIGLLLRLYPAEFRERWGDEMQGAYRAQKEERRKIGRAALVVLEARTVVGMARGAAAEWRRRGGKGTGTGGAAMARVEVWRRELGQAARRLRRAPGFTALAVVTLALGAGSFAAVFTVVESVLLEPMPYESPEELAWVWREYPWRDLSRILLGSNDVRYLAEQPGVEGIVLTGSSRTTLAGPDGDGMRPHDVTVVTASHDFLETLGVRPLLGRGFRPEDGDPAAPIVVLLRNDLWRDAFGADPGVVGRTVRLAGEPVEVVGVLPPRFDFLRHMSAGEPIRADLYAPFQTDLDVFGPGAAWLGCLVRFRGGPGSAEGRAALERVAERLRVELGADDERRMRLRATPLREDLVGDLRAPLTAVLGAAAFLLLVLGANLATLCISRGAVRERDLAVRAAIGGSRSAVAGSVLSEAMLVALGGAAGGALVAWTGVDALARVAADTLPRAADIALDGTGVAVAVGLAGALGLLAAVPTILRARGTVPGRALGDAAGTGGSRRRSRSRDALVVVQVALCLVLLVGGGLLARSVAELLRVDPGFDPSGTLTFRVGLDGEVYGDAERLAFDRRLRTRLSALPGVEAVGAANALPLAQQQIALSPPDFLDAPGTVGDRDAGRPLLDLFFVTPGYVRAAGLRLLDGRDFREGEDAVALVDDVVAARYYPDGSAVGSRVELGSDTLTLVGVIEQPRFHDMRADGRGQLYLPNATVALSGLRVAVRMDGGDPLSLVPAARAAVAELDAGLAVSEVRTLGAIVEGALREERLNLGLVTAFAVAALLLSALGIYGVVASSVARRRPEIGIRIALGAGAGIVARMVLSHAMRLVLAGVVIGLVGAWAASRSVAALLYAVDARDPLTFGAVSAMLLGVGALAAWLPALRATRVDPAEALRET
jgi:putative ABC transport system permease protein